MFARCLAALICITGAWADWNNTSTGIDLDKLPHPKLAKIHAGALESGTRLVFDGIAAASASHETVLRGKGKSGKEWSVSMCENCFDEVWRADLDGNGVPDYVIFGGGDRNGRNAPVYSLSILLMDADGMPVPFFTPVYRGENGNGVKHLVKLDVNIRLLISQYDDAPSDPRVDSWCSGHWVTQLYGFGRDGVEEVRGVIGGIRFPFVHNWAYSDPECANHPVGFTMRAKLLAIGTTSKGALTRPASGCDSIGHDMILFDTRALREIVLPNQWVDTQDQLVRKIQSAGAQVELRGMHECTATLMWARSNP